LVFRFKGLLCQSCLYFWCQVNNTPFCSTASIEWMIWIPISIEVQNTDKFCLLFWCDIITYWTWKVCYSWDVHYSNSLVVFWLVRLCGLFHTSIPTGKDYLENFYHITSIKLTFHKLTSHNPNKANTSRSITTEKLRNYLSLTASSVKFVNIFCWWNFPDANNIINLMHLILT
jgi:hypothetical protein